MIFLRLLIRKKICKIDKTIKWTKLRKEYFRPFFHGMKKSTQEFTSSKIFLKTNGENCKETPYLRAIYKVSFKINKQIYDKLRSIYQA